MTDRDINTVLAVVLAEDLERADTEPAPPQRVYAYEFVIVDPKQGDLHGETFIIRDTDVDSASRRATARVQWLATRLGANLLGIAPTGMVRT